MPFNDDERDLEEYAGPLTDDFDWEYEEDTRLMDDGRWDDDPSPYEGTYSEE